MKRFEPLPDGVAEAWMRRLKGRTLDEIMAMLGPPVEDRGPSNRVGACPEGVRIAWRFARTLRFAIQEGPVKTVVVSVLREGGLAYEFRGEELPEAGT